MTNQNRDPKGTSTGGQFAADVNPESTVTLVSAPTERDESARELSDEYLRQFAEDANSNLDNWFDNRAEEGDDWNEWTMVDALEFMENFEGMIRNRKNALLDDVRRAKMKKIAGL
jgi:hypothetical protein